ncbi:MAG: M3 family oligoendopeptidase [Chlorobia bacterium]|nr:M3 family oligoendopeptidase [Fimbriimonadaceae bacterium]
MSVAGAAPRWDLSPFFPNVRSTEFRDAAKKLERTIIENEAYWDSESITSGGPSSASVLAVAIDSLNSLLDQSRLISSYLECLVTTDSKDDASAAALSEFDNLTVRLQKLQTRFALWVAGFDLDGAAKANRTVAEHQFALRKEQVRARHLMDPRLESLVSDLALSGSVAWSRLHSNLTSQIQVEVGGKSMPMPAVRNLAYEADRDIRQRAYEAELEAWKKNEVSISACLNGIKGEVNTLSRSRNWGSPLAEALFNASIDQATLDVMMAAALKSFPMFRRYLKAKAKVLGLPKLAFFDLFAPVGKGSKSWEYSEGSAFVAENFGRYSQKMGDFANKTFRENWIDAEARGGKVDGAYCTPLRNGESRILMNYDPSYGSVSTLAHELGHAYHDQCLSRRTLINQDTPMTLAETASIFCETIVKEAALESVGPEDQLAILEASLQGQCQVVVDITSRYLFERAVFDKRLMRELSAAEFSLLMLDAQKQTYGDGLDEDQLHPYMWAVKPHYYSTYSFYNFPYMFGLLFGLGLYSVYQSDPEPFRDRYDELLSSTGIANAPTLAEGFGIDLRSEEFWAASLAQIGADVERFEALTN